MEMTHYMELLAQNQPWNLLLFMGVPVILAETIAITELYILFTRNFDSSARSINRLAGILGGVYFLGVFVYLMYTAVVPLSMTGGWRGAADIIAVGFYLSGVIPLVGIALLEFNLLYRRSNPLEKLRVHAIFVAVFLVVAHVAMIFGMLDPTMLGYQSTASDSQNMQHMNMDMPAGGMNISE